MNETTSRALDSRRAHIEAALTAYPDIGADELADLIRWFRRDASALDVALLASNEAIAEPYRRFRSDHIDKLRSSDVIRVIVCLAIVGAAILVIGWRAL